MLMMNTFLKRMFTVFLDWLRPDSTVAKPRCMINTSAAEISSQRLLIVKKAAPGVSIKAA